MKLIIDISEEMYNFACNYPEKLLAGYPLCIKNGTPLKEYKRTVNKIDTSAVDYYNWENECKNG